MQNKCYSCKHRRSLVGDEHSRCVNHTARTQFNLHGMQKGWAWWPHNFDPVWLESCDGYEPSNARGKYER